jgi:ribosomal protein S18 acetylase RimI-like enzyme
VTRLDRKPDIRRILNTARAWALYALADLDDGMWEQCEWWGVGDGLVLVFHGIRIRPIFVMGDVAEVRALLETLSVRHGYLNLQAHAVAAADGIYRYRQRHEMYRMLLDGFTPRAGSVAPRGVVPLTVADSAEVRALFDTGDGAGIAFSPAQMEAGFFRGIREAGDLVAVAGTHVVSRQESVAGVGNVFVRAHRRGHGLAQTVLSAVVASVRQAGVRTIGLNVESTNAPARRAYENLGFRTQFLYVEGEAERHDDDPFST